MPESPHRNHPTTSIEGGSSAEPTPANNVGGGAGWGDKSFRKGGTGGAHHEGEGHVSARNPRSTIGNFLGLQDQKTRAENKHLERADYAAADVKSTTESGEPTCASEDHSFMGQKPGGSQALPGWRTVKDVMGGTSGH